MRAKFKCHLIQKGNEAEILYAHPVYSGSEENKSFSKYTPSGQLILTITNEDVFGLISEGQEFYLDFTPIDK